VPLRQATEGQP